MRLLWGYWVFFSFNLGQATRVVLARMGCASNKWIRMGTLVKRGSEPHLPIRDLVFKKAPRS